MGWNGSQYLVVFANDISGDITYYLLSPAGQIEETGTLADGTLNDLNSPYGNFAGQAPGSGFGALLVGSNVQPKARRITIRWNPLLNRWVVSAGILWNDDVGSGGYYSSTVTQLRPYIQVRKDGAALTAVSYTGRVITLNAADGGGVTNIQPGLRIRANTFPFAMPMVVAFDGNRTVTLDTASTELTGGSVTTILSGNFSLMTREDVFCWTLGAGTPAIEIVDADDVTLENLEIGGSAVDIEERYEVLARPMWKSGGPPMGRPGNSAVQRPSQYSHAFLTPANKIDAVKLVNVRSHTVTKHGYGLDPGNPSFNRATFGNRNRRG
jgi:hypothetical protein